MPNYLLKVIELHHVEDGENIMLCKCSCGKEFLAKQLHLKTGSVKSCGCNHEKEWFDYFTKSEPSKDLI
jgi:hypothetical protein